MDKGVEIWYEEEAEALVTVTKIGSIIYNYAVEFEDNDFIFLVNHPKFIGDTFKYIGKL